MTREAAKQLLPIIAAYAEGKTIQKNICQRGWIDLSFPLFDGSPESYRIKPEPREFWTGQWDGCFVTGIYDDEALYDQVTKQNAGILKIKLREVMETDK